MKRIVVCLAALLVFCAGAQAAGVVVPAEQRYVPYSGELPACDDPGVLARISDRFAQKESEYWNSPLQIESYDRIQEIGFRANGLAYIPRRYCVARALDSDSRERTVVYDIEESLGMIGWGYGVEWCVVGLDRNLAYAPACSALRPFVDRYLGEKALRARY
ncbi:MAG: hypothetical protein ABSC25_07830 [Roseiarcus sp.]|jgi:hypothetical protein